MDPELVKDALEVAKPLVELATTLAGPAAKEAGLALGESIAFWRVQRRVSFFLKIHRLLKEAGIRPQAVPPSIFFPALEAASIQEDDELQDRWAALLTNAANPNFESEILPSFPEKLKQVSHLEAKILDRMYDEIERAKRIPNLRDPGISFQGILQNCREILTGDYHAGDTPLEEIGRQESFLRIRLDNLEGLRLIKLRPRKLLSLGDMMPAQPLAGDDYYEFTLYGEAFIQACRPPAPKK